MPCSGLDAAAIDQLDAGSRDHVATLQALLERRAGQGFVRRCHGDLHLANIALVDGKPVLFDAIEFDPLIATTDVLYDLAFTLMDLIHFDNRGGRRTRCSTAILPVRSDDNLDALAALPLFLSLRAAIRAHVLFAKSEQMADGEAVWREAKRYFDLARRLIDAEAANAGRDRRPVGDWEVGSGARRWLALSSRRPARSLSARMSLRKHLFDVSETTPLPEAAYQAETSQRVYDLLSKTAHARPCPGLFGHSRCGLPAGNERAADFQIWRAGTMGVLSACS